MAQKSINIRALFVAGGILLAARLLSAALSWAKAPKGRPYRRKKMIHLGGSADKPLVFYPEEPEVQFGLSVHKDGEFREFRELTAAELLAEPGLMEELRLERLMPSLRRALRPVSGHEFIGRTVFNKDHDRVSPFLVCCVIYGWLPDGRDILHVAEAGRTAREALDASRKGGGRHYKFTLEKLELKEDPWPGNDSLEAPGFFLQKDVYAAIVPSTEYTSNHLSTPPACFCKLAGSFTEEAAARSFFKTLGSAAILGRVHNIVHAEMGHELVAIRKAGGKITESH